MTPDVSIEDLPEFSPGGRMVRR